MLTLLIIMFIWSQYRKES